MERKKLKLPVGIQTFEEIRTDGYVYVDKTQYLVNMIDNGKIYFFARPRRFGKSLTVTALDALFLGKKDLFNGLFAEEFVNRPNFQPSPVIRLDMSKVITNHGIVEIENTIVRQIRNIAKKLGISLSDSNLPGSLFEDLIVHTATSYNQKVVVLIDEYDKPYTDFVNDPEMADKVRDVLRNYYVQIKACDEYIRFAFITGISKLARFGVFSTLNTTEDISILPEYAEMCGYTEEEIIRYFPDYLDDTANYMKISTSELIEKMRYYYNGFTFDRNADTRLYNPFSTLLFLKSKSFDNFWIESGHPKFIADYMKNRNLTVEQFRNYPVSVGFARNPGDVDTTPPEGFLFQSGYLTLRKGKTEELALDYPNTEVLNSMSELVTQNVLKYRDESYTLCRTDLLSGLITNNSAKIVGAFNRLLASIPYDDFSSAAKQSISHNAYDMKPQEWLYRASILSFLQGCGVVVAAEMHTNSGRPDLVISYRGNVWIIELKVAHEGESATQKAQEAYRQIIEKNYATPYPNAYCLGLAIDDTVRQITESVGITEYLNMEP